MTDNGKEIDLAEQKARQAQDRFDRKLKKAEEGDADAQYVLGCDYITGTDFTEIDYVKAAEWLGKAAAQGHNLAINSRDGLKKKIERENRKKEEPDHSEKSVCQKCLSGEIEMYCEVCDYGRM
jgi:TPR repeat protein